MKIRRAVMRGIGIAALFALTVAGAVLTPLSASAVTGNSGTLWVGQQAVSISVSLSGNSAGMPHVCVHNNGPHGIRLRQNHIRDTLHGWRLRYGGGSFIIRAGGWLCRSGGWANAQWSYWTVSAVDVVTRAYGRTALRLT